MQTTSHVGLGDLEFRIHVPQTRSDQANLQHAGRSLLATTGITASFFPALSALSSTLPSFQIRSFFSCCENQERSRSSYKWSDGLSPTCKFPGLSRSLLSSRSVLE